MQARETLLIALEKELRKRGRKQQELADELGIPRTRISELFNHKTDRFSADKLVAIVSDAGKQPFSGLSFRVCLRRYSHKPRILDRPGCPVAA